MYSGVWKQPQPSLGWLKCLFSIPFPECASDVHRTLHSFVFAPTFRFFHEFWDTCLIQKRPKMIPKGHRFGACASFADLQCLLFWQKSRCAIWYFKPLFHVSSSLDVAGLQWKFCFIIWMGLFFDRFTDPGSKNHYSFSHKNLLRRFVCSALYPLRFCAILGFENPPIWIFIILVLFGFSVNF